MFGAAGKKAATPAAKNAARKLFNTLRAYGVQVGGESLEEGLQESVSIANERRAQQGQTGLGNLLLDSDRVLQDAITGRDQESRQRIGQAMGEGAKISAMMGGGTVLAPNIAANRIEARNRREFENDTSVDDKPSHHTPEEQRIIEDYKAAVDVQLKGLVEEYYANPRKPFSRHTISEVDERQASDAGRLLGGDFFGYKNAINSNGINHIINKHGPNGQTDLSMKDFNDIARVGYVLKNYDKVEIARYASGEYDLSAEFRTADNKPAPMLRYSKKVNGTYYVVEAIPETKHEKFWVVSAYIQKDDGTQASDAISPGNTSATSLASSPSYENNIASAIADVKAGEPVSAAPVQPKTEQTRLSDYMPMQTSNPSITENVPTEPVWNRRNIDLRQPEETAETAPAEAPPPLTERRAYSPSVEAYTQQQARAGSFNEGVQSAQEGPINNERQFVTNSLSKSPALQAVQEAILAAGKEARGSVSISEQMAAADRSIQEMGGYDEAAWRYLSSDDKALSATSNAVLLRLINYYAERGDVGKSADLAFKFAAATSDQARALNILKYINMFGPQSALIQAQKTIQRIDGTQELTDQDTKDIMAIGEALKRSADANGAVIIPTDLDYLSEDMRKWMEQAAEYVEKGILDWQNVLTAKNMAIVSNRIPAKNIRKYQALQRISMLANLKTHYKSVSFNLKNVS
ncbi:MAG: hypothetical protein K6B40_07085 [Firmicutes bacterium]|nr:hypothetical protein [Bacillota bacterium]